MTTQLADMRQLDRRCSIGLELRAFCGVAVLISVVDALGLIDYTAC